ncbi:MAG TPA: T9SS type A sorting domain-containing protein [Candidatus Absconditabacterales bacterium]|nr:T9SS type A sorting domain-containing protein [Candidatus Absconditabacterales bacterium]
MKKLFLGALLLLSTLSFSQKSIHVLNRENPNIPGLILQEDPTYTTVLLIRTTACTDITVKIYTVIGTEVTDFERLTNGIDIKHLTAGVYILQIIEGEKVDYRKLIYSPKTKT